MTTRKLFIKLSDSTEERQEVIFSGTPCEVDDFHLAVIGFARDWVKERKAIKAVQPCECQEKDAD